MLEDTADILKNEKELHLDKIYSPDNIKSAFSLWEGFEYRQKIAVNFDLEVSFLNAGHILGSATVKIEYRGKQIYVSLTKEGRKKAGKYQIDDLKIKKPWRWDKKWRVLIFDVKEEYKDKREALRGKLKDLGLFQLQDSVWVCPYGFQKEIDILREFFGFNSGELKIIEASRIEGEDEIKHFFNLR